MPRAIAADPALVKKYTRNAARDVLQMFAVGTVQVGPRTVTVKDVKTARTIKLGKLRRHLQFIETGAPDPGSREHKQIVETWLAVQVRLARTKPTLTALRALAK